MIYSKFNRYRRGMATSAVGLTTEGDTVDLEAAMLSQGDDDDDVYGKRYCTTSKIEQIGVRQGRNKRRTMRSKRRNVRRCDTLKLNCRRRSEEHQKQEEKQALLEQEEKAVEE